MNYFYLIIVCKQDFSVPENYDAIILHDDFKFIDNTTKNIVAMYKVIGNAVPCHLAEVIANAIYEQAFEEEK